MSRRDWIRGILFWSLMILLAVVWSTTNTFGRGTTLGVVVDFLPLGLVVLLFFVVYVMDRALKGNGRNGKSPRGVNIASIRSGIGYDVHRLAEGRRLMIGGVEVPFDKGSVGHSDGDVLSHALCDALLGAAGLGDIGTHFPDTDPKWKGVSSLLFLEHTRKLLDQHHLRISHLDAIVICERPKLGPYFLAMRAALAKSLGISADQINLKAKTNEGTGEIGRGEAIAAHAVSTLEG